MQKCLYYNHFDTRLSVVLSKIICCLTEFVNFIDLLCVRNTTTIQKDYEVSQSN